MKLLLSRVRNNWAGVGGGLTVYQEPRPSPWAYMTNWA